MSGWAGHWPGWSPTWRLSAVRSHRSRAPGWWRSLVPPSPTRTTPSGRYAPLSPSCGSGAGGLSRCVLASRPARRWSARSEGATTPTTARWGRSWASPQPSSRWPSRARCWSVRPPRRHRGPFRVGPDRGGGTRRGRSPSWPTTSSAPKPARWARPAGGASPGAAPLVGRRGRAGGAP